MASGIAVANGVVYFTTLMSSKLVALDAATGEKLSEIQLPPVWSGPAVSRGRVYVGTGNIVLPDPGFRWVHCRPLARSSRSACRARMKSAARGEGKNRDPEAAEPGAGPDRGRITDFQGAGSGYYVLNYRSISVSRCNDARNTNLPSL